MEYSKYLKSVLSKNRWLGLIASLTAGVLIALFFCTKINKYLIGVNLCYVLGVLFQINSTLMAASGFNKMKVLNRIMCILFYIATVGMIAVAIFIGNVFNL